MKSARFVCLFAILISILVLAQSNRAPFVNQPYGMTTAQQRHPVLPPNFSQMPLGVSSAQRGVGTFKVTMPRRGALPKQGLDFANAVAYGSGGYYAHSVAVADVNGDGKPDLLVANECGDSNCTSGVGVVGVLLGNGDGTFQTAVTYETGDPYAYSLAVADVNGDGNLDLLVANYCNGSNNCGEGAVGVLLGNRDGTFQAAVVYASGGFGTNSMAVGDVNGDGKPDVLVSDQCGIGGSCDGNGTVSVLLGNGDGTFQTAVAYSSAGWEADSVAVGDVNGDGKPDLIVANVCNICNTLSTVSVLLGNGDGTFQTAVTYGSGGWTADSVAVADVNGDGKPDLLVANQCGVVDCHTSQIGIVSVLLGNGDGTFQTAVPYDSGGESATSVAVADVNGDGKPDLLVANFSNDTVGVLLGNGDGTFQAAASYGSGGNSPFSVAVGDVNGDGNPDLVVANCGGSSCGGAGVVGVLINTSRVATTTALVASLNPSNFGQAVTFTATVTPQGGGTPTGTVSFFDGTTNIGNSPLNGSGMATLTTSTLAVGTHSITATYNGDTTFAPSTSPVLYQVVQGAIAVLSPTSLNFGNQPVGITSRPQVTILTNTGNISLTITSIQIAGTNSGDFAQTNNCPSSLSPNNTCNISVTFTPTATGTRNAAVSITDNAPGSPQMVPLTGVGTQGAATFTPTSLTFSTQLVFTSSAPQPVTLTNTGNGAMRIARISVTGPFHQTNNCPSSLNPGANCTISVKFHPTTKGVSHGAVSVKDNAPGSPQKVPLTGTGTFVQLTPAKLNFGTQPVGTKSLPKTVTLTNKGDSAVNIHSISVTGLDAGDFAEKNNCGKHVASGASCFIKVTFKPLVKGKRTAEISVRDDGGGSPQQAKLSGTGT